ncbi:MAG: UDP-N-acetylmuramoyl-L-alanine--D-glutamate ligase, partial [Kiloniellales bacterium]|nr:UDP-N-acetylmuramoyl-L-alanine--D-glutamate ligase [Kiloniellales bacterium]
DSEATRTSFASEFSGDKMVSLCEPEACSWTEVFALLLSPGIPYCHPAPHPTVAAAKQSGVEVVSDIEIFARAALPASIVAITGTNGKSTTTALICHILAHAGRKTEMGGNIGRGVLALEALGADGTYVLELSSYQLETTSSLSADVAILLNISPDHLDRHGGFEGYVKAKKRIFRNARADSSAVIGLDDVASRRIHKDLVSANKQQVIPVSGAKVIEGGVYQQDGNLIDDRYGMAEAVYCLSRSPALPGEHNAQNAAAAYAACAALGLPREDIIEGLETFPGLVHRQERVAVIDGISYINDSKATNPEAAARALACSQRVYWIAGGRAKEGGFEDLFPYFSNLAGAYLIGEAEEILAAALEKRLKGEVRVLRCGTLEKALEVASSDAKRDKMTTEEGDAEIIQPVILLSPACASFDQFPDFEARGNRFRELVAGLPDAPSQLAGGAA